MSLNSCSIRESSYYQFRLESTTTFIKDHNNSTQYGYLNIFMTNILKLLTIDDLQSIMYSPGAGQGVGGVHKQQEEGGPSLETEGGQIF